MENDHNCGKHILQHLINHIDEATFFNYTQALEANPSSR